MFVFSLNLSRQPDMKEALPFFDVIREIVMLYEETERGLAELKDKLSSCESMAFLFYKIRGLLSATISKTIQKNMCYYCEENLLPYLMREYLVKLTRNKSSFDYYPFKVELPQGLSCILTPQGIKKEQFCESNYKSHVSKFLEAY